MNLVRDGVARSATFRALVAALDTSDVIVYVESNLQMRNGFNGYLIHHIEVAGGYRYLRAIVNPNMSQHDLIGVIAHELQHAAELAETSTVRSGDMRALFESLDSGRCELARTCMETEAAMRLQSVVLDELNGRTRRPRT